MSQFGPMKLYEKRGHTKVFNWLLGACTRPESESNKTVESSRISFTVYVSPLRTTLSPTSNGCLMNKNIMLVKTSCKLPPINQLRPMWYIKITCSRIVYQLYEPRIRVPAPVTRVASEASWNVGEDGNRCGTFSDTYQTHGDDQDSNYNIDRHENVVEPADSTIQVAHGIFNRKLFTMELAGWSSSCNNGASQRRYSQACNLHFFSGSIAIGVLVK